MTDPVRISVPPMSTQSPLSGGAAFSPALVAQMLCSVQTDLQAVRAESARATEATSALGAKLDAVLAALERIAAGVEASERSMAAAVAKMGESVETLNLRGWAIEHRMEAMRPAVEAAKAAVEADTAARASG